MEELNNRQQRWLEIIKKSGVILKHYNSAGKDCYCIATTGKKVPEKIFNKLINSSYLVAQNDGFFGDSQTFRAVE